MMRCGRSGSCSKMVEGFSYQCNFSAALRQKASGSRIEKSYSAAYDPCGPWTELLSKTVLETLSRSRSENSFSAAYEPGGPWTERLSTAELVAVLKTVCPKICAVVGPSSRQRHISRLLGGASTNPISRAEVEDVRRTLPSFH
jgi:hypothetical protein